MRHGSAIADEQDMSVDAPMLPDGAALARRLIAFARIAAAMHQDMNPPNPAPADDNADLSLAALLGMKS